MRVQKTCFLFLRGSLCAATPCVCCCCVLRCVQKKAHCVSALCCVCCFYANIRLNACLNCCKIVVCCCCCCTACAACATALRCTLLNAALYIYTALYCVRLLCCFVLVTSLRFCKFCNALHTCCVVSCVLAAMLAAVRLLVVLCNK
jgi:hypothetical protein